MEGIPVTNELIEDVPVYLEDGMTIIFTPLLQSEEIKGRYGYYRHFSVFDFEVEEKRKIILSSYLQRLIDEQCRLKGLLPHMSQMKISRIRTALGKISYIIRVDANSAREIEVLEKAI